jgi:hypothetical protein
MGDCCRRLLTNHTSIVSNGAIGSHTPEG